MVFSATFNNISVISWGETKNHLLHILAVNDYLVCSGKQFFVHYWKSITIKPVLATLVYVDLCQ